MSFLDEHTYTEDGLAFTGREVMVRISFAVKATGNKKTREFLFSLEDQLRDRGFLSTKQLTVLLNIIKGLGVVPNYDPPADLERHLNRLRLMEELDRDPDDCSMEGEL